jgi:putative zinc finger/helix-turn-helix YgiT family protein
MKCYKCGNAEFRADVGVHEYRSAGLPYSVVLVGVPVERCPACGEEVVTIPNPEGLHRLLALNMVEMERPLLPQEVRFLRKLLDKSAEDMGTLMGVDAKTLSRWENGRQKMGKVAERLLRLLVHQRLAPEAANFAEQMFPHLHEDGEATAVRFTSSGAGWRQAA